MALSPRIILTIGVKCQSLKTVYIFPFSALNSQYMTIPSTSFRSVKQLNGKQSPNMSGIGKFPWTLVGRRAPISAQYPPSSVFIHGPGLLFNDCINFPQDNFTLRQKRCGVLRVHVAKQDGRHFGTTHGVLDTIFCIAIDPAFAVHGVLVGTLVAVECGTSHIVSFGVSLDV